LYPSYPCMALAKALRCLGCIGSLPESWWCPHRPCASLGQEGQRQLGLVQLILTWQGRYNDQEGFAQGEAPPLHSGRADPCEFLKCRNLDCTISGSGELRSRSPLT